MKRKAKTKDTRIQPYELRYFAARTNSAIRTHSVATYVDKILKGANPAELPIEQISTYELIIDLRIARETRIQVPQELLYRANKVIR